MPSTSGFTALRGTALTFTDDPFQVGGEASAHVESDALVLMQDGRIAAFGAYDAIKDQIPAGTAVTSYANALILPGFIDTHVHYPQTGIIGSYGRQLIDWLDDYTYVAEQRFADAAHAREVAKMFLRECVRAGTTSAMVFCTVHPQSVDAFFEEAAAIGARMIAGKVLMDRNAPAALLDTPQRGYDESKALIRRWHGKERLSYAITPRFAATSSPGQMEIAGALWKEHPDTYLQSHVSENLREIAWIRTLYPERRGYLDVYDHYGQLGPRAVYGHGVHLTEEELARCHETGTAIAHCPTSNLFLGSGCLDVANVRRADRPVRVGLATDIGAGTSFSALQTMSEAYKVAQLKGQSPSAWHAFYLATRGAAEALYLDDTIGSIAPGYEADLVVLDLRSTALIDFRMRSCNSLEEALFVQMTLGDDRATRATYVAGRCVYDRERATPHAF
ncbi:MAG TPA: guanine deaminase [Rhodanobacteraceae bacterium]|nr:guanine deaminase [Rhodanobacteraceae bacterium]